MRYTLAVILLASLLLLSAAAYQKSFWEDETAIARQAQRGLAELVRDPPWNNHPLLPLFSFAVWGGLFGYDELGLRSLSVLLSICSLALTFVLARRLVDKRTALAAALILGLSPLFVMFGHNARYYSMAMALALIAALATQRHLEGGGLAWLGLYIASAAGLIYAAFGGISVLAACNLWWVLRWWKTSAQENGNAGGRRVKLAFWLAAQLLVALLYLPGLYHLVSVVERYYGAAGVTNWLVEIAKRTLYLAYAFSVGQTLSPLNPLAWVGLILVGAIAIYAVVVRRKEANFWLPLVFLGVIVPVNVAFSFFSPWLSQIWQNLPHWSLFGLPFLAIWLGAGLAAMRPRMALAAALVLLLVYGVGIGNYFTGREHLQPIYAVPWREIFEKIQAEARPDASVVCGPGDTACKYYAERYGIPLGSPTSLNSLLADGPGEVWWLRSNMSLEMEGKEAEAAVLEQLEGAFQGQQVFDYARQDDSIRLLKSGLMGRGDYEYRLNLIRFYNP
jgi:hypothetical protein